MYQYFFRDSHGRGRGRNRRQFEERPRDNRDHRENRDRRDHRDSRDQRDERRVEYREGGHRGEQRSRDDGHHGRRDDRGRRDDKQKAEVDLWSAATPPKGEANQPAWAQMSGTVEKRKKRFITMLELMEAISLALSPPT